MSATERRQAVRAPAKLAMQVKLGAGDHAHAETLNVSANGVYFLSKTHIAPLTRLQITLMLPDSSSSTQGPLREVVCDGVVVRVDPEQPSPTQDHYEVACYFTSIAKEDQERLESYILNLLAF